jgi:ABC-2 type transport system ATP-binding protein
MEQPLIRVRGLAMTFGRGLRKRGHRALDGVDLTVGRGTIFGLLGPNGAGKTTLIKILMGLVPGWEGEAEVLGLRAGDRRARARIGFLPESHRLPGYLTGRQVLRLYAQLSGMSAAEADARIPGWLERIDMQRDADRKVRQYSKGMQQRIGLAQALIHEPELVFLDEPTDGVDPVGRAAVRAIVAGLKERGTTVFINSHLLMEVERMCERVVIVAAGKIVREGTVEELARKTGRVAFELGPVQGDLERVLGLPTHLVTRTANGFEAALEPAQQDQAIDRLRAAGVSIRSITPGRLTLEDAFIELVKEGRA